MPADSNELERAIAALVDLRQEHREILLAVAGDPGMAPDTRRVLIGHMAEEEDEKIARIANLAGVAGGAPTAPAQDHATKLTVGSLRADDSPRAAARRPAPFLNDHNR